MTRLPLTKTPLALSSSVSVICPSPSRGEAGVAARDGAFGQHDAVVAVAPDRRPRPPARRSCCRRRSPECRRSAGASESSHGGRAGPARAAVAGARPASSGIFSTARGAGGVIDRRGVGVRRRAAGRVGHIHAQPPRGGDERLARASGPAAGSTQTTPAATSRPKKPVSRRARPLAGSGAGRGPARRAPAGGVAAAGALRLRAA